MTVSESPVARARDHWQFKFQFLSTTGTRPAETIRGLT